MSRSDWQRIGDIRAERDAAKECIASIHELLDPPPSDGKSEQQFRWSERHRYVDLDALLELVRDVVGGRATALATLRRQRHRPDALQRELDRGERFAIDLFRVDTGEELGRIHAQAVPAPGDIVEVLKEEGSVAYRVTTSFGRRWVARAGDARASRVMLPVDRIMPWSFEPAIEPVGDLTRGPRPALRETDFDDPATVGGALDQARRLLERAAWLAAGVANGHPETAFAADAAAVARGATHLAGRADQVLDAADEVARRRDYDPIPFGAGEDG